MANKETPPPPPAADAPPPRKGKKLIIIAIAAVVLLVGIGGAAFMVLKPHPADEDAEEVDQPKKAKKKKDEKPHGPPAYFKMEAFTVNLQGESGDQFLRIELSARFEEAAEAERAKQYTPSIRNKVLLLLSGKKAAEIAPKEGKEKLAQEILTEINGILAEGTKDGAPAKEILFTEFVIQ